MVHSMIFLGFKSDAKLCVNAGFVCIVLGA